MPSLRVSPGKFIVTFSTLGTGVDNIDHSTTKQATNNLLLERVQAELGKKRKTNNNNAPSVALSKKQRSTGKLATPTHENTIK
jgi:hypothetical protein